MCVAGTFAGDDVGAFGPTIIVFSERESHASIVSLLSLTTPLPDCKRA